MIYDAGTFTNDVEEYLQLEERDPDTRYDSIDGRVYAMAEETAGHDTVKAYLHGLSWHNAHDGQIALRSRAWLWLISMLMWHVQTQREHSEKQATAIAGQQRSTNDDRPGPFQRVALPGEEDQCGATGPSSLPQPAQGMSSHR